jgi:uncharacterized protein (UPF0276 family)
MTLSDLATGIGLRQPHYREVFDRRPGLGFVEVHSENFFLDGGASIRALERARELYPVSLHGVGLSLGSADGLVERHLDKLERLVDRIQPAFVSEHLSWGCLGAEHFNDLLPMPLTHAALALVADRVDHVQNRLGRRILVENISAYVAYRDCDMTEPAFLAALARRTGCAILFDINNLYVNAVNFGFDPVAWIEELPPSVVGQMHLAGHAVTDDGLVDTHGSRVCEQVWALYAEACRRLGPKPTLIEWDTDLPSLEVLLDEAAAAQAIAEGATEASSV